MKRIVFIFLFIINCNILHAREHPHFVCNIARSSDSKYIAIGRLDGKVILIDRENKKILKVIESKVNFINWNTAFTPDSKYFVFQDPDMYLDFYNIEKGEITRRIKLDDFVGGIAFFKDMKKMIWGGCKGKVEVIDLETEKKKVLKIEHPDPEYSFAQILDIIISPDERYFLTIMETWGFDLEYDEPEEDVRPGIKLKDLHPYDVKHQGVNLWDAKTFKKINRFVADDLSGHTGAAFSKDGKYIVITSENGVTLWDLNTFNLLYSTHVIGNACEFVDQNSEYFVVLLPGHRKLRLYKLQDIINPKEPIVIKKERFIGPVANDESDANEVWEDLVKNGYIDEKGVIQPKLRSVRGPKDLSLNGNYPNFIKLHIFSVLKESTPLQMKMLILKRWACPWAMVTDPDRNLVIIGDGDGSISIYKFDPKKLEIKLEWHPKSIVAGIIRWLDPIEVMLSSKEEIGEMTKKYEVNQLRIIDEERRKGKVETKYETIQVPEEKQKDQKQPVSTLTPVK